MRMITLTSKCYYAENPETSFCQTQVQLQRCKTKAEPYVLGRYLEALNGSTDMATNTRFRVLDQGIVTYTQDKLGLSAYYNKCIVAPDGIDRNPLR